jgi:2-oxoglutarate/2-oxoacid ferredoxin oxidoreductase subunit beta
MDKLYPKDHLIINERTNYCPGCSHGLIQKIIVEVIEDLGIRGDTIGVSPVGCGGTIHRNIDLDFVQAAHGRAPAVATGIKRVLPTKIVFTYQGDGDLFSIGTANIIHAAARAENITVFFVNNATFGMTGGQMAPTTLLGQKTTTSPTGRNSSTMGFPIRVCEILASLEGDSYIARIALNNPKNVRTAKKYIRNAFSNQINNNGFSLVEFLSICPTNLKMSPVQALTWLENNMIPYYKSGEIKKVKKQGE